MNITDCLGIDRPTEIVSVSNNTVQMSVTGWPQISSIHEGVDLSNATKKNLIKSFLAERL